MILLICALLFFSSLAFADADDKNPWSVTINGNKIFSKFQLNEQLDIPDEFGQLDTIKQDFLMRLSSENVRALYFSRGYFSLDLKMEILREPLSNGHIQRTYSITVSEGDCYRFNDAKIISSGDEPIPIDLATLKITKHQYYNQEDISEDLQEIQKAYRKQGNLHVYISSEEHVDTTAKQINVIINVNPGPKVLMGNIITTTQRVINKNERKQTPEQGLTDTSWLSSLWRIPHGEIIDGNQYFSFKNKLYSTQLFTQVKLNDELRHYATNANIHGNIMMPVMGNIGNFLYILCGIMGALIFAFGWKNLSLSGYAPITNLDQFAGMIALFLMMSRMFANNVNQFSQQLIFIVMGMAGASRCLDLMDEKPETDDGYVYLCNVKYNEDGTFEETEEHTRDYAWKHQHKNGELEYKPLKGDIVLDQVDFSYDGNRLVLEDVSIYAHPGQKIAFVGATGAGKTTITNLINRFYDIADGKIRYDGININKIKKADLRKSLGIVLQDVNLFTGTVMDNIRYGRLDATDEECIKAAKIANAHDFITRLPEGYNTMLSGDGANLSQGQRQLLSIARAAVADAPVMILDEATSSIDTRTEKLVQQGTDQLMEGRTVFVIAHRLSTVQNSNAIMVLDHGHIIERGTHDDLIAQKGVYYNLYTGAFELE